uniref:Uncharacterized protein n=1 Tax=Anguilla anguilla TaxID=7936 RepID=A0A0E9SSN0_ANGAN
MQKKECECESDYVICKKNHLHQHGSVMYFTH